MQLTALLQRHEGKTLEFKRDLSSPANVLKTIIAFANSAGGVLVIGVEDRTRNVRGVATPLDIQERLANIVAAGITPPLMPAIEVWPWRDKEVDSRWTTSRRASPGCAIVSSAVCSGSWA